MLRFSHAIVPSPLKCDTRILGSNELKLNLWEAFSVTINEVSVH